MENEKEVLAPAIVETDIIADEAGTPTSLEISMDSAKALSRIQAVTNVIEGCTKISLQRTNPKDWVRMTDKNGNESFYLQATGVRKIRPIWGIYYRDRRITEEKLDGTAYSFIAEGVVGSKVLDQLYGEVTIEVTGARSSNDAFFTRQKGVVDKQDVRKAALANWEVRAVSALLGLGNMLAADLAKNGIKPEEIAGYEFKSENSGSGKQSVKTGKPGCISEAQTKRLYAIAKGANKTDADVKMYLKKCYDLESASDIKWQDYEAICNFFLDAQEGK